MENSHHGRDAINPLEAETQINQHPQQRIEGGQPSLGAQLAANLGADDFDVTDAKVGEKETIRERSHHGRIDPRSALQLVSRIQNPALNLVAIVDDGLRLFPVFLIVGTNVEWVFVEKIVLDRQQTRIVQVRLSRRSMGFQRLNNLELALIESLLAGLTHVQVDQLLVIGDRTQTLKLEITQARMIQLGADRIFVRRVRELHINQRSTAEVNSPRNVVPEQHGKQARDAEDQRKGEKIPLFSKKIDVGVAKELHGFV